MKELYIVTRKVVQVHGHQTFTVEAESYEEAAKIVMNGRGTLYDEHIEVVDLSDSCHVHLPDDRNLTFVDCDGKIRRPNPQDHPGPSGPRVHPVVGPLSDTEQKS